MIKIVDCPALCKNTYRFFCLLNFFVTTYV
jgi:hypothetical protein